MSASSATMAWALQQITWAEGVLCSWVLLGELSENGGASFEILVFGKCFCYCMESYQALKAPAVRSQGKYKSGQQEQLGAQWAVSAALLWDRGVEEFALPGNAGTQVHSSLPHENTAESRSVFTLALVLFSSDLQRPVSSSFVIVSWFMQGPFYEITGMNSSILNNLCT